MHANACARTPTHTYTYNFHCTDDSRTFSGDALAPQATIVHIRERKYAAGWAGKYIASVQHGVHSALLRFSNSHTVLSLLFLFFLIVHFFSPSLPSPGILHSFLVYIFAQTLLASWSTLQQLHRLHAIASHPLLLLSAHRLKARPFVCDARWNKRNKKKS